MVARREDGDGVIAEGSLYKVHVDAAGRRALARRLRKGERGGL